MEATLVKPAFDRVVKRCDIYYVLRKSMLKEGREIQLKGGRPAVIVSSDSENLFSGTVEVVYLTSGTNIKFLRETQFRLTSGKCISSIVKCEQITTVDKTMLGDFVCDLSLEDRKSLDTCLLSSIGINQVESKNLKEMLRKQDIQIESLKSQVATLLDSARDNSEIVQERDRYKQMYEDIIKSLTGKN